MKKKTKFINEEFTAEEKAMMTPEDLRIVAEIRDLKTSINNVYSNGKNEIWAAKLAMHSLIDNRYAETLNKATGLNCKEEVLRMCQLHNIITVTYRRSPNCLYVCDPDNFLLDEGCTVYNLANRNSQLIRYNQLLMMIK